LKSPRLMPRPTSTPPCARSGGWGFGVALAILIVTDSQRLDLAFAPAELPVRTITTVKLLPLHSEAEIKRLAAQVRARAADRDRLTTRITALEHKLDSLSDSIKRLAEVSTPATRSPQPKPSAPTTTQLALAELEAPKTTAAPSPIKSLLAMPAVETTAASGPDQSQPQADNIAVESHELPTQNTAAPALKKLPLPPVRVTATTPAQLEFGIALAATSTIEVARLQWVAVKANFGPIIAGL
jgi:hypothetical protein